MSPRGRRRAWIAVVTLLAASGVGAADARAADRLIVRFDATASAQERTDARQDADARLVTGIRGLDGAQVVRVDEGDAAAALRDLRADPSVAWAERDVRVHALATPSDPRYDEQWALPQIAAPAAWNSTVGDPGVIVAVVDTGVSPHPDVAPNLWTNPGEGAPNGVDDDGNGLVDDRNGWDWVDWDGDPVDHNGHGTHVAAILGARGNDGIGTAGVAWRTRIMPVRVLDGQGQGWASNVAQGIAYAARMGARVVNLSLGGPYSHVIEDAIAIHPDVLIVAAAGNDGADVDGSAQAYPCELPQPNVVCVAASDRQDQLAPFSNHGATGVDLAAPGTDIVSAAVARKEVLHEDFAGGAGQFASGYGWAATADQTLHAALATGNPGAEYTARTPSLDIRGLYGCRARMRVWFDGSSQQAGLTAETLTDAGNELHEDFMASGPRSVTDATARFPTPALDNSRNVIYGLSLWTLDADATVDAAVDDVVLECVDPTVVPGDVQESLSGTSMATPFVSGAAALAFAAQPHATAATVRQALLDGVRRVPSLTGQVASGGVLDVDATVHDVIAGDAAGPPTDPPLPDLPIADGWRPGTLDPSWGDGGVTETDFGTTSAGVGPLDTRALPDGRRVIVARQGGRFLVTHLRRDGNRDTGFGDDGTVAIGWPSPLAAAVLPDGGTVLLGWRSDPEAATATILITRRLPDGSPDPSFGDHGTLERPTYYGGRILPVDVVVDGNGRILFPEQRNPAPNVVQTGVVRLLADGRPDPSFGTDGATWFTPEGGFAGTDLDLDTHGGILLGGYGYAGEAGVVRLQSDGSVDDGFGRDGVAWVPFPNASADVNIDPGPDDRITVASSGWVDGTIDPQLTVMRFLADGRPDRTFGYNGIVESRLHYVRNGDVEVLPDGRTVLSAYYPIDVVPRLAPDAGSAVIRLLRNGRLDPGWADNGVALRLGGVNSVDLDADADGAVTAVGAVFDHEIAWRVRGGREPGPSPQPTPTPTPEPTTTTDSSGSGSHASAPSPSPPPAGAHVTRPPRVIRHIALHGRRLSVTLAPGTRGVLVIRPRGSRHVVARRSVAVGARPHTVRIALDHRWRAVDVRVLAIDGHRLARRIVRH